MFDTPVHVFWTALFLVLDAIAFVWLIKVVRRRRRLDATRRDAGTAAQLRKRDWAKILDEREAAVTVSLVGDRMTVEGGANWPEALDLTQVTNVSMVVAARNGPARRYLEFRGPRTYRVPVMAQGFDVLTEVLKHTPGFDATQLEEAMWSTVTARFPLLAKPLPVNARLVDRAGAVVPAAKLREEFTAGLVLVRDAAEIGVSWDVTYDALMRIPEVSVELDAYQLKYVKLGRVRVGGLELDDLRVRLPKTRTDVPVKTWQTAAVLTHGGDENYRQLKAYLAAVMDEQLKSSAVYERADQNSWQGRAAGVRVGLVYWYNSEMTPESRYCSLSFENARVYPEYLRDAYSLGLTLEGLRWAKFAVADVRVERDFRASVWVREAPSAVCAVASGTDTYVVWRDESAEKIGFADPKFAVIAYAPEATGLELQNVSPGKGGGYAELALVTRAGQRVRVGTTKYRGLDQVVAQIAELTGLPLTTLSEFNDS